MSQGHLHFPWQTPISAALLIRMFKLCSCGMNSKQSLFLHLFNGGRRGIKHRNVHFSSVSLKSCSYISLFGVFNFWTLRSSANLVLKPPAGHLSSISGFPEPTPLTVNIVGKCPFKSTLNTKYSYFQNLSWNVASS